MKINPDCIRCLLFVVEANTTFHHACTIDLSDLPQELSSYGPEEILYHIRFCGESGLISDIHFLNGGTRTSIRDLTPTGHEFLSNIRDMPSWKKILKRASGASIPILIEIAKQVALQKLGL